MTPKGTDKTRRVRFDDIRSNELRKFILTETPRPDQPVGFTANDYKGKFPNISLSRICNVLTEMVEEEILSRRRNRNSKYEYFLINYHDPDDYIEHKRANMVLSSKFSSVTAARVRIEKRLKKVLKAQGKYHMTVQCECGKVIGIDVESKVHDED